MREVGYITKKVLIILERTNEVIYVSRKVAFTHRLYYAGDKIGNIPVALAVREE